MNDEPTKALTKTEQDSETEEPKAEEPKAEASTTEEPKAEGTEESGDREAVPPQEESTQDQDDPVKKASEMTNEILGELSQLGEKLGQAVQEVIDGDGRQQLKEKVVKELKDAGDQVDDFAKKAGHSRAAREFQEGAEKIGKTIGDGLLSGLQALNKELSKVVDKEKKDKE